MVIYLPFSHPLWLVHDYGLLKLQASLSQTNKYCSKLNFSKVPPCEFSLLFSFSIICWESSDFIIIMKLPRESFEPLYEVVAKYSQDKKNCMVVEKVY